jgi:hypothetical protein
MSNDVSLYSQTNSLKKVMLGNFVDPEYFDSIENTKIKNSLQKICVEIHEDLNNFKQTLFNHGVDVVQVELEDKKFDPDDHVYPVVPRDNFHVIGDKFYIFNKKRDFTVVTKHINQSKIVDLSTEIETHRAICEKNNSFYKDKKLISKQKYLELAGPGWPLFDDYLLDNYSCSQFIHDELSMFSSSMVYNDGFRSIDGPNVIVLDDYIIVDQNEYCQFDKMFQQHIQTNHKITTMNLNAGHTDGSLMFTNSDCVVGIAEVMDLLPLNIKTKLPIPWENYQEQIHQFQQAKKLTNGKWWIPGAETDEKLSNFINEYLIHWTGYTEETVFDVNFLLLNTHTAFVSNPSKELENLFQKIGVNVVHVPWRHRFFIDAGLHCMTLDLWRE